MNNHARIITDFICSIVRKDIKIARVEINSGKISLVIPEKCDATSLINNNINWLIKKNIELNNIRKIKISIIKGNKISIAGKYYSLFYNKSLIYNNYTIYLNKNNKGHIDSIASNFINELYNTIKIYLDYYHKKYGYKYNKIYIKKEKTKWGSCTYNNNLNFNIYMMFLPKKLIRYIVFHEFLHLNFKNHSNNFHEILYHEFKEHKKLDQKLLAYYYYFNNFNDIYEIINNVDVYDTLSICNENI